MYCCRAVEVSCEGIWWKAEKEEKEELRWFRGDEQGKPAREDGKIEGGEVGLG